MSLSVGKHGAVLCLISLGSFGFPPLLPPFTGKRTEFVLLRRCPDLVRFFLEGNEHRKRQVCAYEEEIVPSAEIS